MCPQLSTRSGSSIPRDLNDLYELLWPSSPDFQFPDSFTDVRFVRSCNLRDIITLKDLYHTLHQFFPPYMLKSIVFYFSLYLYTLLCSSGTGRFFSITLYYSYPVSPHYRILLRHFFISVGFYCLHLP